MTIEQISIFDDVESLGGIRPSRIPSVASYLLYSMFGICAAIVIPILLAVSGIGMSRQEGNEVFTGGWASLLAIVMSFVTIRRLLNFPLLRGYSYVAMSFIVNFLIVAIGLKFFQISFSSPQFFFGLVIITTLVELFFYVRHRGAPMNIAVVPNVANMPKVPKGLFRSLEFTQLAAAPNREFYYNGIIADLSAYLAPEWERFLAIAALRGVPVYNLKDFNESVSGRVAIDHRWENTLGALVPALIYPQIKRAVDLVVAIFLLPLVAVIIGIASVLIKLETPGPIVYRQQRIGMGGRRFTILKLRTMTHNHNGDSYTAPDDGRITRVGRVLRQYRIDELPQIMNILCGDMSWIGPRPEALALAAWYEREVPFYAYRHIVRPGISGWAQVHQGNVATPTAARLKLEYDFFYIKHFSFWLDAVILIKTMYTIVTGFGSR